MTSENMIKELKVWEAVVQEQEEIIEQLLGPLEISPESKLYNTFWMLQNKYSETLAKYLSIDYDWLQWYQFENQFGTRQLEVIINGNTIKVCCIEDLFKAFEI